MYILMALGLALQDARPAHDRAVQPPAQPRLVVACLGLIARLQLLLQLPHLSIVVCVRLCARAAWRVTRV